MTPHQGRILEFSLLSDLKIIAKQQHWKMINKSISIEVVKLFWKKYLSFKCQDHAGEATYWIINTTSFLQQS